MRPHRLLVPVVTGLLALLLVAGCGPGRDPGDPTTSPPTDGAPMTYHSAEEASLAQRETADALLAEVTALFTPEDASQVDRYLLHGNPACTLDAPPALAWRSSTRFEVPDQAAATTPARAAVVDLGWEPLESADADGEQLTYHRNAEGFVLSIAHGTGQWVMLGVESPCFAADGTRLTS